MSIEQRLILNKKRQIHFPFLLWSSFITWFISHSYII